MPDDDTSTYQDFLKEFQPGVFLGTRYKILKAIGVGGMGRVFMTHDLELDQDVALKVIRPELLQSEKAIERFKNELILARKVSHKNVVRIHDIGEVRGLKYLTMTYIPGKSLKETLRQSGGLSLERSIRIFTQICEGVAAAHEEGVVHRDLKPANVMLDENDRVYLTDFGIAKWLDAVDETESGVMIGTPAYLSPEQTWGERPDARSDIYALGLILYELLTGELPFDQEKAVAFKSRLPADLPQRLKRAQPEIPRYLIAIIEKCLDPGKNTRYQTVSAILHDLNNRQVSARRFRFSKAILAVCVLMLLSGIGLFLWLRHPQPAQTQKSVVMEAPNDIRSAVVLPFRNKTGKQELSWIESAMGDLLTTDLARSSDLRVMNSDRVYQLLKDLKIPSAGYDDESALKVGELLDVGLVIQGDLTQAGSTYRADVQVFDRTNPGKKFYARANGNRQEDLLPMVDQLSKEIQQQLNSTPPHQAVGNQIHHPPIAALQIFQEGIQFFRQENYGRAIASFNECILKDPKFGQAYLKLAKAYSKEGEDDQAAAILQKAIDNAATGDEKTNASIHAEYASLQGDFPKAIEVYKGLDQKYSRDPEILLSLASLHEQNGDLNDAISVLQKVIELDRNQAQAYFQLGKDTILAGNPDQAISNYLIKALSLQTQLRNRQGQADVLNAMGVGYERLGRYDDALKYYQDSYAIKKEIGNKRSATTSLSNIAKIYIFQSQFDKAKSILNQAAVSYNELKDQVGVADVQNTFGVIYENQGQYAQALSYYKNALQIRKELGDDRLTAVSYDNIGQIYYLMGHYDESQAFSEQALSLRKKVGDQNGVILSLQNLGFLQMAEGKLNQALKYFLDALNQARAIEFENAIAVSLGNLATIYQSQGRYDAALDSYREAIDILKKLNDKKGQAEYTRLTGATFLEMGAFTQAETELQNAKRMAKEIGSEELVTDTDILLARLYRLQNRSDDAQKAIDEAIQTASKDSYEKGMLGAKIEQGWLTHSDSIVKAALTKSEQLGDVWLEILSQYSLASVYLKNSTARRTIEVCENALPLAKKMESAPYLYRFHSLEAQAYQMLNDHQNAKEQFEKATASIELIQKSLKPELLSGFLQLQEVRAVMQK